MKKFNPLFSILFGIVIIIFFYLLLLEAGILFLLAMPFIWVGILLIGFIVYAIKHSPFWLNILQNYFGAILISATVVVIAITIVVSNYNFVQVTQQCCDSCSQKERTEVVYPPTPAPKPSLPQYSWQTLSNSPVLAGTAPTGCNNLNAPNTSVANQAAIGNICQTSGKTCSAASGWGGAYIPVIQCTSISQQGNWHTGGQRTQSSIPVCPGHGGQISPDGDICYANGQQCGFNGKLYTCQ